MNRVTVASGAGLLVLALLFGCAERPDSLSRAQVGSMPDGLEKRPVASEEEARQQCLRYFEALGLQGLSVDRVRPVGGRFLVYVSEETTGRGAFGLQISPGGEVEVKKFPAMAPEMMWNQKYGHRARRRDSAIEMKLTTDQARTAATRALGGEVGVSLGSPIVYYGYYLFPLLGDGDERGEAAVNAVDGEVVWKRFPRSDVTGSLGPSATQ